MTMDLPDFRFPYLARDLVESDAGRLVRLREGVVVRIERVNGPAEDRTLLVWDGRAMFGLIIFRFDQIVWIDSQFRNALLSDMNRYGTVTAAENEMNRRLAGEIEAARHARETSESESDQ